MQEIAAVSLTSNIIARLIRGSRAPLPAFIPQLIYFVKDVFGPVLSSCNAKAVSQDTEGRSVTPFTERKRSTAARVEHMWHAALWLVCSPSSGPWCPAMQSRQSESQSLESVLLCRGSAGFRWVIYCKPNTVSWETKYYLFQQSCRLTL